MIEVRKSTSRAVAFVSVRMGYKRAEESWALGFNCCGLVLDFAADSKCHSLRGSSRVVFQWFL